MATRSRTRVAPKIDLGDGQPPQSVNVVARPIGRLLKEYRAGMDPLKEFYKDIPGGKLAVYALLFQSKDDEDAQTLARAWETVCRENKWQLLGSRNLRGVDVGRVLEVAEMTTRDFVGIVTRCAWDIGVQAGKAIFAMKYPKLMAASMKRALENDATDERRMHLIASGHLPTGKGIQIGINNVNRQDAEKEPEPGEAPAFARTVRKVVRDLPPAR